MKKKLMAVALATIIAVMAVAGASLAWLKDTTTTVVNTFTEGKVDIELAETPFESGTTTANSYKMIPGNTINKDPVVTVKAVSEECWLFVEIVEVNDVDTFLTYAIADGWTKLSETSDANGNETIVIYRKVADTDIDQEFYVLKADADGKFPNGAVTVNTTVEMSHMNDLTTSGNRPQLKFTAYAIQSANIANVATAWDEVK